MNDSSGSPFIPGGNILGRFEFVRESPGVALTSVLILAMAALVGTFGNLLILVSVCHTIKRKSLEFIFVGNLALSDSFVTLIVDPINILGKCMYTHCACIWCNCFHHKKSEDNLLHALVIFFLNLHALKLYYCSIKYFIKLFQNFWNWTWNYYPLYFIHMVFCFIHFQHFPRNHSLYIKGTS